MPRSTGSTTSRRSWRPPISFMPNRRTTPTNSPHRRHQCAVRRLCHGRAPAVRNWPCVACRCRQAPTCVIRRILARRQSVCKAAGIPSPGHSSTRPGADYGLVARRGESAQGQSRTLAARPRPPHPRQAAGGRHLQRAAEKRPASADQYAVDDCGHYPAQHRGADLAELEAVHAMTDITGFGLLGHLLEITARRKLASHVDLARLPMVPGWANWRKAAISPGASERTGRAMAAKCAWPAAFADWQRAVLTDPQTIGGLLVSCAAESTETVLRFSASTALPRQRKLAGWKQAARFQSGPEGLSCSRISPSSATVFRADVLADWLPAPNPSAEIFLRQPAAVCSNRSATAARIHADPHRTDAHGILLAAIAAASARWTASSSRAPGLRAKVRLLLDALRPSQLVVMDIADAPLAGRRSRSPATTRTLPSPPWAWTSSTTSKRRRLICRPAGGYLLPRFQHRHFRPTPPPPARALFASWRRRGSPAHRLRPQKGPAAVHAAYNDAPAVTAAFNSTCSNG